MERMDWQNGPGERLEGIIGDKIVFGEVGKYFASEATQR